MMRSLTVLAASAMILIALVNLSASLAIFQPGAPTVPADGLEGQTLSPAESELIGGVGGLTSVTGISVLVVSLLMIAVGAGLLLGRTWYMAAMLALGSDITFKVVNIISQLVVGESDLLLAVVLIVVEAVVIFLLFQERTRRGVRVTNRESAQSG